MPRKFLGTSFDMGGARIVNVGDASGGQDVVNLQTMQAYVRGLKWKDPVRAGSTGNVTLTAPGATMDGVTLANGDRVLLKNQTNAADNGIYVWSGASSTLIRSVDADSGLELQGAAVLVLEGTQNDDKMFTQNADIVTLGSTALTWAQFGGGASATYVGTNGVDLTGNTLSVKLRAGSALLADTNGLGVDYSLIPRKYAINVPGGSNIATITHNFNTLDVDVTLVEIATGDHVEADVRAATVNTITLTFGTAPTVGQYRVVVQG